MKTIRLIKLIRVALLVFGAVFAMSIGARYTAAESYGLPTMLKGLTTAIENPGGANEKIHYGGWKGDEAVLNLYPDISFGFNELKLENCTVSSSTISSSYCFQSYIDSTATSLTNMSNYINLMKSRTYVNSTTNPRSEMAVLLYPSSSVIGDAYSGSNYLNNFAFWGRNLAQTEASNTPDSATWRVGDYVLNPDSQSKWLVALGGDETGVFEQYHNNIEIMADEANSITSAILKNNPHWYLLNTNGTINPQAPESDEDKSSEGRVWKVTNGSSIDDLNLSNSNITYHGKGTIVVQDLTISGNTTIGPAPGEGNSLGIIVRGNLTIEDNATIDAAVLCFNTIDIDAGDYLDLKGSYVAKDFSILPPNGIVRFNYNFRLSSDWPPGFRYLSLP